MFSFTHLKKKLKINIRLDTFTHLYDFNFVYTNEMVISFSFNFPLLNYKNTL